VDYIVAVWTISLLMDYFMLKWRTKQVIQLFHEKSWTDFKLNLDVRTLGVWIWEYFNGLLLPWLKSLSLVSIHICHLDNKSLLRIWIMDRLDYCFSITSFLNYLHEIVDGNVQKNLDLVLWNVSQKTFVTIPKMNAEILTGNGSLFCVVCVV